MKSIYTFIVIIISILLIGCSKKDRIVYNTEEQVALSDFITIVKINEITKTETTTFGDNREIPKTFFSATKIADIKGFNETDIVLSCLGGYKGNKFVELRGGDYLIYDGEYNLYEIDEYYLVAYKIEDNDILTLRYWELSGYDENKSHLEQNAKINKIIQEYLNEIEKQTNLDNNNEDI